jgi:hypothetical protein
MVTELLVRVREERSPRNNRDRGRSSKSNKKMSVSNGSAAVVAVIVSEEKVEVRRGLSLVKGTCHH